MEKIKKYWGIFFEKEKEITKVLKILGLLLPIISLGTSLLNYVSFSYRKINFKRYYGVSSDLVNFDTTEIFQNLMMVLVIFILLIIVEKIKEELDKTKKMEYILSILFLMYIGMVFGVLTCGTVLIFLTFFSPDFLQEIVLGFSENFYLYFILIITIASSLAFIGYGINSPKHKRKLQICKLVLIIEISLLILYNIKDIINLYKYKRDYEVIRVDNKLKVVLYKTSEKVFVVNGEYNKDKNTLILDTKKVEPLSYDKIEENKLALEYEIFPKVDIKDRKKVIESDKNNEIIVRIGEKKIKFLNKNVYLKKVNLIKENNLNSLSYKFYIGKQKNSENKVYGDVEEYLIDELIFKMIKDEHPAIKIYEINIIE